MELSLKITAISLVAAGVRSLRLERSDHAPLPVRTLDEGNTKMTREEALAQCPSDSYVEFYGNQWLIIPFASVAQPPFFDCTPGLRLTHP